MELLVKRDKTILGTTVGTALVDEEVPEFLRQPMVVDPGRVNQLDYRSPEDDLLLLEREDASEMDSHLTPVNVYLTRAPAVWSGYRSVLTKDPETGRLFRLKGVALNPLNPEVTEFDDGMFEIHGGTIKSSVEFEQKMSDRFNRVLREEGIDPVMQCRGMWKYPILVKGNRPAASVVEVKGDTRLDELMQVLECLAFLKLKGMKKVEKNGRFVYMPDEESRATTEGRRFYEGVENLYHDIGFVTGRLKNLMDRNGQTWSSTCERSNAHIGNIVVYNGTDKLRVGLVDFDASCDITEMSRSQLKAIQQNEFSSLRKSALSDPISSRKINGKPFSMGSILSIISRERFNQGFVEGYDHPGKSYTNTLDLGNLHELFALLRADGFFTFVPQTVQSPSSVTYIGSGNDKTINLEDVIKRSRRYEEDINNNSLYNVLRRGGDLYGLLNRGLYNSGKF